MAKRELSIPRESMCSLILLGCGSPAECRFLFSGCRRFRVQGLRGLGLWSLEFQVSSPLHLWWQPLLPALVEGVDALGRD